MPHLNLVLNATGLTFEELQQSSVYEAILLNHVNSDTQFNLQKVIPGFKILATYSGPPKVNVINAVIVTEEQRETLLSEIPMLKGSSASAAVMNIDTESQLLEESIINPKSGRSIKVGGPVYNKLVREGVIESGAKATGTRKVAQPAIPRSQVAPKEGQLGEN